MGTAIQTPVAKRNGLNLGARACAVFAAATMAATALAAEPAADTKLAFTRGNGSFNFDTGLLKGAIKDGKGGEGLKPITFIPANVRIDAAHGLLAPYRFLTPTKRYGFAAWVWPHKGSLLDDGGLQFQWEPEKDRPFSFTATYRWASADTVDLTLAFTPDTDLEKFELFVGSYMNGFKKVRAYVDDAGNGQPGFLHVRDADGVQQLFPRDKDALALVGDGRWTFGPHPNKWTIRPALKAPLLVREQPNTGVAMLFMTPPADCFAISVIRPEGGRGNTYLSLFGKDVKSGQTLTGRVRVVFGKGITDAQILERHQQYLQGLQ